MRDAKCAQDLAVYMVAVPSSFVWLTATDAAWANRLDDASTIRHLTMAAHPNMWKGRNGSCLSTFTLCRACRLLRVMWREVCGDLLKLDQYEFYLRATDAICDNDYKSLAGANLSARADASEASEDERITIEMSMIKQSLAQRETRFQWLKVQ